MTDPMTLPVPLEPLVEDIEDRRLWIGNLDPRITEFTLVKLLQTYGSLEKFDMLFHRTGPLEGQPRGYAFVTYSSKEVAEIAKKQLDGKLIGRKNLCVKWAHSIPKNDSDKQKVVPDILALGGTKSDSKKNRSSTIKAIEAKLRVMESTKDSSDFKITDKPTISQNTSLYNCSSKPAKSKYINKVKSKSSFKTRWKI